MAQMSFPLDNEWYSANSLQLWLSTRTNGVFSSNNDLICQATGGRSISISPGIAWLSPARFVGAVYGNTESISFTLDVGDGIFPRIDRVVIRWDFVASPNRIYLAVKKGVPASTPVSPALQRNAEAYELGMWDIRVNAGVLTIIQGNISDLRANEALCGIMRDGVTGIPTQALYDAWYSWFNTLKSDAETKVNTLISDTQATASEFIAWMDLFKTQNETELTQWIVEFKQRHEITANEWFLFFTDFNTNRVNLFLTETESDILAWFEDLQNTLDENQAANLFNKIDRHERTGITDSDDGVHNLRLKSGKFQAFIGIGWATLATVPYGFTGEFFNAQDFTGQSFNLRQFTGYSFNNVIRVEVD